jgi:tetratricopeptide (TPR) repeat protein
VKRAAELAPNSSLAQARLAELHMSSGRIRDAERAALRATEIAPDEARAHMVLGFVYLAKIDTKRARTAFERAIELDSAEPLARLGIGLAEIREGRLTAGREQLEIAVALDPQNSLLRSYLGKAYYEENTRKRDQLAKTQFGLAKGLDPNDPTPWFYEAILEHSKISPSEAIGSVEESLRRNDNAAVHRSRLLLDRDLAARTASLAHVYRDLGMPTIAISHAARSLARDPTNYSAHRFLADTYLDLPRHEIARASELLQAQLWNPLSPVPLQSAIAPDNFALFSRGLGPSTTGVSEYTPLFQRDSVGLSLGGLNGSNNTRAYNAIGNLLHQHLTFAFATHSLSTDGFGSGRERERQQYVGYFAAQPSPHTSLQFEALVDHHDYGDLIVRFDPTYIQSGQNFDNADSVRFGLKHEFSEQLSLLLSMIHQSRESILAFTPTDLAQVTVDGTKWETQLVLTLARTKLVGGISHFRADLHEDILGFLIFDSKPFHYSGYLYTYLDVHPTLTVQAGISEERLRSRDSGDNRETNPKLGIVWAPNGQTTLRAAVARTLKRRVSTDQGLEPTQVAGFNQFFDDANGTVAELAGLSLDRWFSYSFATSIGGTARRLITPHTDIFGNVDHDVWKEREGTAQMSWLPSHRISFSVGGAYTEFIRQPDSRGPEDFIEVTTWKVPLSMSVFWPERWRMRATSTQVRQKGTFIDSTLTPFQGEDSFHLLDFVFRYNLPRRLGYLSAEVRNALDERFRYQATDLSGTTPSLTRTVFIQATLAIQ